MPKGIKNWMRVSNGLRQMGVMFFAVTTIGRAAQTGPYLTVDIEPNIAKDLKTTFGVFTYRFPMDPGLRFGVEQGYAFNRWFSAEFETGFVYNELRGADSSWFAHVPMLANAIVRYENNSRWVPFLGGGFGASMNISDITW